MVSKTVGKVSVVVALLCGSLAARGAVARPATGQTVSLFGLVIGYNGSSRPQTPPLRYADDDAVKNAQLLEDLGAHHVLLTEFDPDSRRLYPDLAPLPPTRRQLETALATLNEAFADARRRGYRTSLILFYSGHGDVDNAEGYIELRGERLTRTALRGLLRSCEADVIHLVIDACKSYFVVFDRGPGGSRHRVTASFITPEEKLPAQVGLLLSASAAQDSHEWEAYQAGVFSHEVRSALRGSADINGNGSVSYDEVAAFVFAANRGIANPRYRPAFFARAPAAGAESGLIVDTRPSERGARLVVGPDYQHHIFVESARGDRIADLHPHRSLTLTLLLPAERPLFVHEVASHTEYVIDAPARAAARKEAPQTTPPIRLASLTPRGAPSQPRGAVHVAFTTLFSEPFGPASVTAYHQNAAELERMWQRELALQARLDDPARWARPALGWTSLGLAAIGGALTAAAYSARDAVRADTPNAERVTTNERIERYNRGAAVASVVAVTGMVSYLLWRFFADGTADEELQLDDGTLPSP